VCSSDLFLSNVGEVDEMAENAWKILNDETVLRQFKYNAWEQAKKFKIENVLPKYEQLYESLIRS
jgi:glycosyltransferase involved in cell wall biosynthesis